MGASIAMFGLADTVARMLQSCEPITAAPNEPPVAAAPPPAPAPPETKARTVVQCNAIETTMSRTLAETCCSDAFCAAMPDACTHGCRDVLLPYYTVRASFHP
eukprot:SAG11_NODE_20165_length_451_cov_1.025568_1_plen_102_part_10